MRQREKQKSLKRTRIAFDQIDILEVLDELGIEYRESGKNVGEGWIGVCCCFCGDEGFHLGIHLTSKSISCFKCGVTGTVIKFLAEELKSYSKAIEILGEAVPRELRTSENKIQERSIHVELPKDASKKITKYHAAYLQNRGYNYKELTEKYHLHFCGPDSEWNNRIIVPVKKRNKLITFTSIDISDDSVLRYRHLSDEKSIISIKQYLFGLEFTDRNPVCCLVEGLFDQFRISDGSVASFGTNITAEQKQLLTRFSKVVIAFDGDSTGRTAAEKIANDLCVFCDIEIIDLPEGKDPDSLSEEEVKFIRNKIGRE